jgi:hypothetical protein
VSARRGWRMATRQPAEYSTIAPFSVPSPASCSCRGSPNGSDSPRDQARRSQGWGAAPSRAWPIGLAASGVCERRPPRNFRQGTTRCTAPIRLMSFAGCIRGDHRRHRAPAGRRARAASVDDRRGRYTPPPARDSTSDRAIADNHGDSTATLWVIWPAIPVPSQQWRCRFQDHRRQIRKDQAFASHP